MASDPIQRLLDLMARLRAEGGCPWDREQTLDSLKQYLIEESYEVVDAIDSGDPAKHREELGDLLLQVVFQAQLRRERNEFTFHDVVALLCEKLVRRHPHVFAGAQAGNAAEALKNWEAIKAREGAAGAAPPTPQRAPDATDAVPSAEPRSVVAGIPRHLPALHRAHQVQKKVARVGFDWTQVHDVVAKIEEELAEVKEALAHGDSRHLKAELGDLLFAVVNLSRFQGINAEEALEDTIRRFTRRFQELERRIRAAGREVGQCSPAELDAHWNAVKAEERK